MSDLTQQQKINAIFNAIEEINDKIGDLAVELNYNPETATPHQRQAIGYVAQSCAALVLDLQVFGDTVDPELSKNAAVDMAIKMWQKKTPEERDAVRRYAEAAGVPFDVSILDSAADAKAEDFVPSDWTDNEQNGPSNHP